MEDWVREQINQIEVAPGVPLIISDADEVLFQFVHGLEAFLAEGDLYLDLASFRLSGNIKYRQSDEVYPLDQVPDLLSEFFEHRTAHLDIVDGARDVLNKLHPHAQIIVLTNVPAERKDDRVSALERHGLPFPVIANSGAKGPAAAHLAELAQAPTVFIDDIPPNLDSVKQHAEHVHCIQFVSHPRLSELIDDVQIDHPKAKNWLELDTLIRAHLFP